MLETPVDQPKEKFALCFVVLRQTQNPRGLFCRALVGCCCPGTFFAGAGDIAVSRAQLLSPGLTKEGAA